MIWFKDWLKIKIKMVKNWLKIKMKWVKDWLKIKMKWIKKLARNEGEMKEK